MLHVTISQFQVGSNSVQGAGAPTMFQAMRRIVDCLGHGYLGEGAFERVIRSSFLGITYSPFPLSFFGFFLGEEWLG